MFIIPREGEQNRPNFGNQKSIVSRLGPFINDVRMGEGVKRGLVVNQFPMRTRGRGSKNSKIL